jgi:hypothetical protein
MTFRTIFALTLLTLGACQEKPATKSLVGDFPAPGVYALAGDTLTVWRRVQQPNGAWRLTAYSITPGGAVESVEELERLGAPDNPEEAQDFGEKRREFVLPQPAFETIRGQAALLRPQELGPADPVGGFGGEAQPAGCASDPAQMRLAGITFLNKANWGSFVLPAGCDGAAAVAMGRILETLERSSPRTTQASR